MSFYQQQPGDVFTVSLDLNQLLDVVPSMVPDYPKVTLRESQYVLNTVVGVESPSGVYTASITVPSVLDLEGRDFKLLELRWELLDAAGDRWQFSHQVQVLAPTDREQLQQDVITDGSSTTISALLPMSFSVGDTTTAKVFKGNTQVGTDLTGTILDLGESSRVDFDTSTLPADVFVPMLSGYTLHISGTRGGRPYSQYLRMYKVTPAVMNAASQLEKMLHKSRIEQTIPSLKYTEADLLLYLQRGLDLFNAYPPALTDFTGLNMQGAIQHGWMLCSMIQAVTAQLIAEGEMSFDFQGQAVQLNVDRTPALNDAISRWEAALESQVRPLKQLLGKNGITGGDGDISNGALGRGNAIALGVVGDHNMINYFQRGYSGPNNGRLLRRFGGGY